MCVSGMGEKIEPESREGTMYNKNQGDPLKEEPGREKGPGRLNNGQGPRRI